VCNSTITSPFKDMTREITKVELLCKPGSRTSHCADVLRASPSSAGYRFTSASQAAGEGPGFAISSFHGARRYSRAGYWQRRGYGNLECQLNRKWPHSTLRSK